ncbi:ubiquitin-like modifier-activating enzyme ATG7 [Agrilus planipennis]|uniref:Ubiquitin-like modifier-activating enzyme ATG7 n=1 Tax=Agrilus planipennis TaxID=224129 RepID=A0A1W4XI33_AGRPL|nr:ubiquitin-like modifier-activating enzyme ATG7 [Agrilus planipennis]
MNEKFLEFVPYSSVINPSFWSKVVQIKLDVDKLHECYRPIWGFFTNVDSNTYRTPLLEIDSTSFNLTCPEAVGSLYIKGHFVNKNTIESFKECDKAHILHNEGLNIWKDIISGAALDNPSLLNKFFILAFAELKKYHFYYWCLYPCISKLKLNLTSITNLKDCGSFNEQEVLNRLLEDYLKLDNNQKQFFLIKRSDLKVQTLNSCFSIKTKENILINEDDYFFCFSDPCMTDTYAGWPLRNYILFLLYYCPKLAGKSVNVISFRIHRQESQTLCDNSIIFTVRISNDIGPLEDFVNEKDSWIGWERNEKGNFGPKFSNMRGSLDPVGLTQSSAELNLKLMKWNLVPNLDLERNHSTKCLLFGAGTLGCAVSRSLMSWGVKSITLIDGGKVSFSNPVRQCLYTYEDSLKGIPKSVAAVKNLKEIYPLVDAHAFSLFVPMPGHPVGESLLKQTLETVKEVEKLVKEADVIFLLTDSRESRWLPTVLGSYYGKIVINAALGFDSYLVMRHGVRQFPGPDTIPVEENHGNGVKRISGENLGCYFCNDVTAPGDSLHNRTLDQQCTITRPGVSMIAGALAVELAISVLQHKDGGRAAAYYKTENVEVFSSDIPDESLLGIVPHSIRGFLSTFSQVLPATQRYKQCIACSDVILNEYKTRGFEFLMDIFNSSKLLEKITGIEEIYKNIPEYQSISSDEEFTD